MGSVVASVGRRPPGPGSTALMLFVINLGLRVVALLAERAAGIDMYFHTDAAYYVEEAQRLLEADNWVSAALDMAFNNELFTVICAGVLSVFNDPGPVVAMNMVIGSWIPVQVYYLARICGEKRGEGVARASGFLVGVLPYQVHLSLHVLKDTLFVAVTLSLLIRVLRGQFVSGTIIGGIGVGLRTFLGVLNLALSASAALARRRRRFRHVRWIVPLVLTGGVMLMHGDLLLERNRLEIEGRAFFENVDRGNVEDLYELVRVSVIAPFRTVIVPNILLSGNLAEMLYGAHIAVPQLLLLFVLARGRIRDVVCHPLFPTVLTGLWFVEVTVPRVGPLVRYREVYILLLTLILSGVAFSSGQGGHGSRGRGEPGVKEEGPSWKGRHGRFPKRDFGTGGVPAPGSWTSG